MPQSSSERILEIYGVNERHDPFMYLDYLCPREIDWDALHDEVSFGIARSQWWKRPVSAGVHPDWAHLELGTYALTPENSLTPTQLAMLRSLSSIEERIKFYLCITPCLHPFWTIMIRGNKRTEVSGVANKAVAADCAMTENAQYFPSLLKLVDQMPFESVGRIIMFLTEPFNQTVPHYDAMTQAQRAEKPHDDFIWFQTRPGKRIYVMNHAGERVYPDEDKRFIWWNEMDYHGTEPHDHFSFSIRIDGKFKPGVKQP